MSTDKNTNLNQILCKVQYQFIANVNSISRGSTKLHRLVSFINDLDWLDIYASPASIDFEEQFSKVDAGSLYKPKLSLNYPGEDSDTPEEIESLIGPGLIIKLTWSNETEKIIGDIDNPVRILPDFQSNSSKTGYTINVNHQSPHRAYLYEILTGGGGIPD